MYYFFILISCLFLFFGQLTIFAAAADKIPNSLHEQRYFDTANALSLSHFSGQLEVRVVNLNGIRLNLNGSKEQLAALTTMLDGNRLFIEEKPNTTQTTVTTTIRSNHHNGRTIVDNSTVIASGANASAQVVIGDDKQTVRSSSPTRPLRVSIEIPSHSPIHITDLTGTVTLGDLSAPLSAQLSSGELYAGRLSNTLIEVFGSGDVQLAQVTGDLTIKVHGSGDVNVVDGAVKNLRIHIKGSGDVVADVVAEQADLSVAGSGDIEVRLVRTQPQIQIHGNGDIEVGNW